MRIMTYAGRRAKVAALLAKHDLPAILVTHPVNVRYLTGLASSNAAALIHGDGSGVLATDARYAGTAEQLIDGLDLVITRDVAYDLRDLAGRVAVEGPHLSVSEFNRLGGDLVPVDGLVESVRAVKDEEEIEL